VIHLPLWPKPLSPRGQITIIPFFSVWRINWSKVSMNPKHRGSGCHMDDRITPILKRFQDTHDHIQDIKCPPIYLTELLHGKVNVQTLRSLGELTMTCCISTIFLQYISLALDEFLYLVFSHLQNLHFCSKIKILRDLQNILESIQTIVVSLNRNV